MKGIFNACDKKNLKLNNPDYVKQYKTGREYFGWEDALSSACIKTNFGIFTSAKRTRVKNDKGRYEYFVTLANEKEEITLKQNQLCNKKMPKNAVRVSKVNTFIFKGFKYQLCLPAPKDLLEQLIDELNYFMREDFLKRPEVIAENEKMFKKFKEYEYELIPNDLNDKSKIYNILYTASLRGDEGKIYKKLLSYLHPDHCTKVNASELTQYLVKVYKVNFKK